MLLKNFWRESVTDVWGAIVRLVYFARYSVKSRKKQPCLFVYCQLFRPITHLSVLYVRLFKRSRLYVCWAQHPVLNFAVHQRATEGESVHCYAFVEVALRSRNWLELEWPYLRRHGRVGCGIQWSRSQRACRFFSKAGSLRFVTYCFIIHQGSHAVLEKYWIWPKRYIEYWKSMAIVNGKEISSIWAEFYWKWSTSLFIQCYGMYKIWVLWLRISKNEGK